MSEVLYFSEGEMVVFTSPIAESEVLESRADERDRQAVEGITSPTRRAERLAWRQLLREVSAEEEINIEYNSQGAPALASPIRVGDSLYKYISVSHCRDRVVVALSSVPCGVDVEQLERNFGRVAEKYLSAEERELCAEDEGLFLAKVWCAKETLYKMAQMSGLDFRRDIRLTAIDQGTIVGDVAHHSGVRMLVHRLGEKHIVVHTL